MASARFMSADECAAWYWTCTLRDEREHLAWLLLRWRVDPVCFAIEALRIVLQPYQAQILLDLNDAPQDLYDFYGLDARFPKRQVLVPSGHGLGKTRTMAVGIWHHQITHPFSKRLVTAPTGDQITGNLFGEIRKMYRRLKRNWPMVAAEWDVLSDTIRHRNPEYGDWATVARTARPDSPEAMQGAHALDTDDEFGQLAALFDEAVDDAPSGGMMVLVDEASGVADTTRETLEGTLSEEGAKFLAAGNPTRPDGWFAEDLHNRTRYAVHALDCRMSDRTRQYEIPYRDFSGTVHRLTLRGFVHPSYWVNILAECNDDEDHDRVRVRVRGVPPRSATEQVIRSSWIEDAQRREPHEASAAEPVVLALDFGLTSDKHAIAARQGFNVRDVLEWLKPDAPQRITLEAKDRAIEWQRTYNAKYIIGDANGIGRGAMEALAEYFAAHPELNVTVVFFNAGAGAVDGKRYFRRRDEMWFAKGRPFFADPRTHVPVIAGLKLQLCTPQYSEDHANRIRVESKDDVRARTGEPSGNAADAVLMTLMVTMPVVTLPRPSEAPVIAPVFESHFKRWAARRQGESGVYIR